MTLRSPLALAVILVASVSAQAQINFDAANSSYFVVGGTNNQINTNYGFNNVFVGKNNLASFTTLPGTISLTIGTGASINGKNTLAPNGSTYYGVNVFGSHQVNMTGGFVSRNYGYDNSTVNISGGQTVFASGFNNSAFNLTAGTVSSAAGFGNSLFSISGGTVFRATLNEQSTFNVSGGSVGIVGFYGTSTLNLVGSNFTVVQSNQRWGLDPTTGLGRVQDYTITGSLTDGTAFNRTLTASVSGASLLANSIQLRGASLVQSNPLYFTSDGTADSFASLVTVGRNSAGTINTSPSVSLETGLFTGIVTAYNNSVVTMNGGEVVGSIHANDSSNVTIGGGTVNIANANNSSTVNVTGGEIKDTVFGYGNGTVNITGGKTGIAWGFDNSTINVQGGQVHDATSSGGVVNISGGAVDVSFANGSTAVVNISGGSVGQAAGFASLRNSGGTFNVSGGTVGSGSYAYYGNGTLNVSGGTLTKNVSSFGGSIGISGGSLAGIFAQDTAVTVSGGNMGNIGLSGFSELNLAGNGFNTLQGSAHWGFDANYGTLGWVRDYTINGALGDGTAFSKTITAAANGATLEASNIQLQGQAFEIAPDLYITDDGSVNDAYNSITVGLSEDGATSTSPTVTLGTGMITGYLNVFNDSVVNLADGNVAGALYAQGNSTSNLLGGTVAVTVSFDTSTVNILGGSVGSVKIGRAHV